ncbi:MAG: ParB/RepB/Spo0J family partition protein [Candidatus Sumerlaeaceae bacterium]
MIRNFEEVKFDDIAWSDTSSRTTMRRVPPLLRLSVREVGVLNPLIVAETQVPDRFAIVTGWLRFQAAREVGENSVPCHIYRSFPPKILLLCSLFDNLGHRHLNPVEQAIALRKLGEFYTPAEIRRTFLPMLNIHTSEAALPALIGLAELPEDLQWAIADNDVLPQAAPVLNEIPHGHRQHILRLFRTVNMAEPSQLEVADAFRLLLKKKAQSPLEIMQEEKWVSKAELAMDPDVKVEQDLLQLEVGLAAVPTLFASRRSVAGTHSTNANYLAPNANDKPKTKSPVRKKPPGKQKSEVHAPTESQVLSALQRRVGKLQRKTPQAPRLPAGARLAGNSTAARSQKLEVDFTSATQLCDTLRQLLDAGERGALQAMLQRR